MSRTIPPFPQYAFMAWCSVKSTGTNLSNVEWEGDCVNEEMESICTEEVISYGIILTYAWND
jgi:hypothetical protein